MKLVVEPESEAAGRAVADLIADAIRNRPGVVLSLPTGSTPAGTLAELVRMHQEEGLDFSGVSSFNMDEYVGLPRTHPQSYYYFLHSRLYSQVNIPLEQTFSPEAAADDLASAADTYTDLIYDHGGFDLIFLGIGRDGHISFNMPGSDAHLYTHTENLSAATVADNARFFGNASEVPTQALTIGVKVILDAEKVVLLATGSGKSDAVAEWLNHDRITTSLPASLLWLHPDLTVVLDEDAAGKVTPERLDAFRKAKAGGADRPHQAT